MADFKQVTITNKGRELLTKLMADSKTMRFTSLKVSNTGFDSNHLSSLTSIGNIKQIVTFRKIEKLDEFTIQVEGLISNKNLTEGYYLRTLGLFAQDPDEEEILYAVASAQEPGYLPPYNGKTTTGAFIRMVTKVGNADKIEISINPSAVATIKDIEELRKKLSEKDDKLADGIETKADKSTTYTKDEVNSKVDPKADKSYVDGELSKRADKATTYTKDEINSKIAGQVKSVNGHRADGNGEVTLPKLKAKTLTGYDVKNKVATFDDNAGFDGNGNFSRWPVDQGVIGQLAEAINAKLPIEEGPANADLLMNAGNKIVYWHGNGDAVKNLPPMNNKQYFFAVKLFDTNWGSVTVIDQDGGYWLNTKNGDVWTGWRSVVTNEHLKKLKFVKQSLDQSGNTFQDTKFVTQEADGTFKINIYDSDWTANKVSWLLKNTKSYSIDNDTDLNNVKNTGFYNAAGTSGIKNSPVSAWFSMSVNANQWNGQQTLYDTNTGQFYVRTWNSTSFTAWRRVINEIDFNDALANKANTSDVNARLPLSGGNMNKGAFINWNGGGINDRSGKIGGLYWQGATDKISIFADENGNDNLDLAIQLGDDNSNHVSFRRADGAEVAAIWSNGHYTGTTDWNNVLNRPDINNANPSVTVINSFDVANVKEGPHQTWPVKQPWLVDQMALHPFAEAINALNINLSTLRTELMNLKRRVDYNSPQGEFNNTTVNINDLRSTGIYRFANCYIQNGPYPTNNTHWIYLQVTVFDANTVYQTLYEGDNMYGRKSYSPTNWGKWHKYLNQEV